MGFKTRFYCVLILCFAALFHAPAIYAGQPPGLNFMGMTGLITVPDARMDTPGTFRAFTGTLDPYAHSGLGFQIAEPLYVGVRQTARISSVNGDAERLFPGLDFGVRLRQESTLFPAVKIGIQSALGHKRMASETISFSKRFKDFDFTTGLAWGRLGSAGHFENPLKILHSHFGKSRDLDSEKPQEPDDWFTGEDIGAFAGLSYDVPRTGLRLKAEWGADRYIVESQSFDFNAPSPWAVGFDYSPRSWVTFGTALVGGEKIMARLNVRNNLKKWPGKPYQNRDIEPMRPYRTGLSLPSEMQISAEQDGIELFDARRNRDLAWAALSTDPNRSLPHQLGEAMHHMANHAGETVEGLAITPTVLGLTGPTVRVLRRDLEQALARDQSSPEEIWHNAAIDTEPPSDLKVDYINDIFPDRTIPKGIFDFKLTLDNELSLSEDDSGVLYRTSLLMDSTRQLSRRFSSGLGLRFNIRDNLHRLREFRTPSALPVRSDVDLFADTTVAIDRLYTAWTSTIKPGLHFAASLGHLEEMYGGIGGELLYRPLGKRYAIGGEAFQVFKRDPGTSFNLGFTNDSLLTGHLNFWYEMPDQDLTFEAKAGRYLAEDLGLTLSLSRRYDNGAKIEAFVTATDQADFDIFGGTTHLYSGLRFSLPLGNSDYLPEGSRIRVTTAPIGRDTGQHIDKPLKLYDLTEQFSVRHISQQWSEILHQN